MNVKALSCVCVLLAGAVQAAVGPQRARICNLYPQSFDASDCVRYLSNAGDDAADGKTPQTAWRTIEKLNADLPAGGTARLKCGDVFYGSLRPKHGLSAACRTVIADYGEGPKPVISCSKIVKPDPLVWESLSHCFWRVDLCNPTNFTGLATDDCNPGFLLVDGEVKAWKRYCHGDLVSPWDFCGEDGWLYVHADENPATLAKDIRVALCVNAVTFDSHTLISNIAVRVTGAHGMHAGWGHSVTNVTIARCDFENIGGSELLNFSPKYRIRYGNGIELGGDAKDVLIDGCTFRGVYDVAFTMQGMPKKGWRDVTCRNCTMTDCTQAFEVWCKDAPKGVGFERCSFTGNRTLRVGGGWGPIVRPMRACATPLLMYRMETDTIDIDVSGNTFENAPHGLFFRNGYDKEGISTDRFPAGYRVHDNAVVSNRLPTIRCNGRIGREGYGAANWWLERLNERRRIVAKSGGTYDLVMLGDSITHNFDMRRDNPDRPGPGYAAFLALKQKYAVLNCGYSGDGYEHVLWRLRNGELEGVRASNVMLLIGTNNRYGNPEETALGIQAILDELFVRQPQAHILLMAIFPCGANANDAGRRNNERVNELIREYADGKRVVWIDLRQSFLDANGDTKWIMPDRLHPTAKGYDEIWLPAIFKELKVK